MSSVLSQKKKSYFRSDWPITVLDTHTPFHHWQLLGGEEMMHWWTEQHEQNRTEHTHIHRLSQHAGAHRQSCIQRWALVLSTIDKDVINVPTGFLSWPQHLLSFSFIWAPYWPASTGYKCIVERQVNPGMDSYVIMASSMIKTKLSRQVKTTLFNHNESVI